MEPKQCPKCNVSFEKEDIYEFFLNKYKDEKKALESASFYGWTKENPLRFSSCIGIYDLEKDRTVQWGCPVCKYVWDKERL